MEKDGECRTTDRSSDTKAPSSGVTRSGGVSMKKESECWTMDRSSDSKVPSSVHPSQSKPIRQLKIQEVNLPEYSIETSVTSNHLPEVGVYACQADNSPNLTKQKSQSSQQMEVGSHLEQGFHEGVERDLESDGEEENCKLLEPEKSSVQPEGDIFLVN